LLKTISAHVPFACATFHSSENDIQSDAEMIANPSV
jgi:hypothetical protein